MCYFFSHFATLHNCDFQIVYFYQDSSMKHEKVLYLQQDANRIECDITVELTRL